MGHFFRETLKGHHQFVFCFRAILGIDANASESVVANDIDVSDVATFEMESHVCRLGSGSLSP